MLRPAQANNAHVFPGLALGCIATGSRRVNDDLLLAAAEAIADAVTPEELAAECVLPSVARLRETAAAVAAAVARAAYDDDLASVTVDSARCIPSLRSAAARRSGGGSGSGGSGSGDDGGAAAAALECVRRLQYDATKA